MVKQPLQRKTVRLSGWDYALPYAYHVTICTKGKKRLLSKIDIDGRAATVKLTAVGDAVDSAITKMGSQNEELFISSYVIMPNHVHILLKLSGDSRPLSSYVGALKAMSTKTARAAGFAGELWQRGFYDHIIRGEKDYLATIEYIENNPAKWAEDRFFE